jgi:predicted  nucleic acid-binding Zn-ribbon protein
VPHSCPDCGSAIEFASQPAQLLTGSCAGCGHSFTLLEGVVEAGRGLGKTAEEGSEAKMQPNEPESISGPVCSLCGAPLEITATPTGLSAVCSGCSSSFQYVLRSDTDRPFRRPTGRGGYRSDDRSSPAAPRARPCRNCGGPLQFTTSPDGLVTGTCASCGNRFTLPPRREEGGRGRGGRPGQRGGYPSRPRGSRGWGRVGDRGAPPPRFRSRGPPPRRREARGEGDEDESPRTYRRRRDDE